MSIIRNKSRETNLCKFVYKRNEDLVHSVDVFFSLVTVHSSAMLRDPHDIEFLKVRHRAARKLSGRMNVNLERMTDLFLY